MARGDTSPLRRTFPVAGAPPVRLRLAAPSDRPLVRALLERRGVEVDEFELARLLAFDPGRHHVLAAFAPLDGRDALVGIGAIESGDDVPHALVVDERLTGLADVLGRVLTERARHRRAA
jgi:hypothetical protein